MATELYQQMLDFEYADDERADLMRKVWQGTPWMLEAYSGSYTDQRCSDIMRWCYETFGAQAMPFDDRPGRWYRGGCTIHGWTWFGFSTEAEMKQFMERWPPPPAT